MQSECWTMKTCFFVHSPVNVVKFIRIDRLQWIQSPYTHMHTPEIQMAKANEITFLRLVFWLHCLQMYNHTTIYFRWYNAVCLSCHHISIILTKFFSNSCYYSCYCYWCWSYMHGKSQIQKPSYSIYGWPMRKVSATFCAYNFFFFKIRHRDQFEMQTKKLELWASFGFLEFQLII